MNELEILGIKTIIKQALDEQLNDITQRVENLEYPTKTEDEEPDYDPSEDYPVEGEDEEEEEPEESVPVMNPEHVQAMEDAREQALEGPIPKEQMEVLHKHQNPEHGRQSLQKAHAVNKIKTAERQAIDKGFDDEPEAEDDLSEFEEQNQ